MGSVPELRFPEFSGEWREVKIKDIFQVTRGQVLSKDKMKDAKENDYIYPVYSSQTKNDGLIGYYNDYLFEDAITWTTDGANAGFVRYRKDKFYCTNVSGVLLSNKGFANKCIASILNLVTKKYVSYVGNPKLMNNVMSQITIKIPPSITEQQKIADFLSAIDEKITLSQEKITRLEAYKKGMMQKLLSGELRFPGFTDAWREVKLGEIATFSKGKGISKNDISKDGKCECIRYGELFTAYKETITQIHSRTNKCKNMKISDGNETLMPTSDVTPRGLATASAIQKSNVIIGGDILIIKSSYLLNTYLAYLIRSNKTQIMRLVSGVTVYHIYADDMKTFRFKLPSLPEQQKIADFLTAIDDKLALEKERLEALKRYKQGLLQKMFV